MKEKEIIELHWLEIKGAIRSQWDFLSDKDLEKNKEKLTELFKDNPDCQELVSGIVAIFDDQEDLLTPWNESYYESHQTAPRSSEISEFQDDSRDIKTRCPERKKYEEKAAEMSPHHRGY